ncbi:MAG TPA: crotonase/enoyl-CoA hydratase family protein [Acidimicrobiia bacterium]|jgi:enoyl-CoA hydratase|nr:crotonase/enoyl-CoA hydratase family protein [Acidimicrobiia bacterium]HIL45525.1 crotonase/enoyl-CoA hydratase family protein [Acidimicrobiia bacterium]
MSKNLVTIENDDNIAILHWDDGKANVLGYDGIAALLEALDEVEAAGADAVVLSGQAGKYCAGFDLAVMKEGNEAARGMLARGVDLFMRLYLFPRPVVSACTGHAIAAGAIMLMCTDLRVGAQGKFKIGLPEVTIGMSLPFFATELARDRLSKRHYTRATALGYLYSPDQAVDVGYLDEVVAADQVLATAVEQAHGLTGISRGGLVATRQTTRAVIAGEIKAGLAADLANFDTTN